jgi:hypothetical protein
MPAGDVMECPGIFLAFVNVVVVVEYVEVFSDGSIG